MLASLLRLLWVQQAEITLTREILEWNMDFALEAAVLFVMNLCFYLMKSSGILMGLLERQLTLAVKRV